MIDFGKTFCDLHPHDIVSNFCCKQECFVGLCATCICSHTEMHMQNKTTPQYENIRTTYTRVHEALRDRIHSFQHEKKRINNIINVIQAKRKQATESLETARAEAIDFVNRFFDNRQREFLRRIESEQKKHGLHSEARMDNLLNAISRDINTLFVTSQELTSQNFLESFQRIRTQVLVNAESLQREISQQVDRNECFQTNLLLNPTYLNQIKASLEKAVELSFSEIKANTAMRTSKTIELSQEKCQQTSTKQHFEDNQNRAKSRLSYQPEENINNRSAISIVAMRNNEAPTMAQIRPQSPNQRQQIPHQSQIYYPPQNAYLQKSILTQSAQPQTFPSYQPYYQNPPFQHRENSPANMQIQSVVIPYSSGRNHTLFNQSSFDPASFQMKVRRSQIEQPLSSYPAQDYYKEIRGGSIDFQRNENSNPKGYGMSEAKGDLAAKSEIKKVRKGGLTLLKNLQNKKVEH